VPSLLKVPLLSVHLIPRPSPLLELFGSINYLLHKKRRRLIWTPHIIRAAPFHTSKLILSFRTMDDGSMNQPNHGQPNFAAYQQDPNYALTLSPQPGDETTSYAELTNDVTSPLFITGDTNNNNAMDALTAAAVAAKPATPKGVPQQPYTNSQPQGGSSTPLGKVVETGQEHTGRWTKEEHDAFLTALQLYG